MGASVLIVDDHAGFRTHARRLLECEGYSVVGEAADSASAVEAAKELVPELALVDVHLPDADGFELTSWLRTLADPPSGRAHLEPRGHRARAVRVRVRCVRVRAEGRAVAERDRGAAELRSGGGACPDGSGYDAVQ